jgi:hypothetical protein
MMKVIELRKIIKSSLLLISKNVYFQIVPDGAVFPYLVYDLPNSNDDGSLEQFVMDIDGWDLPIGGDTTVLETMMENVRNALHRKTFTVDNNLAVTFYCNNRLALIDEDKRIRRRKYTFEARTFERR